MELRREIEVLEARRDYVEKCLKFTSVREDERVALHRHLGKLSAEIASLNRGVVVPARYVLASGAWWESRKAIVVEALVGSLTAGGVARAYGLAGARLRMWAAAGGVAGFFAAVPLTERAYRYTYPR